MGLGAAAVAAPWGAMAGPFSAADFQKLVPADKKLQPDWVKSLFERGAPTVYRGSELNQIGMPVGGICAGQLYLGGDGKLWHWDIFNRHIGTDAAHYAKPLKPSSPIDQGFALKISTGGQAQVRPFDRTGWKDISFRGEYPIGRVEYRDAASPVSVTLEAFSPFIPLNAEDSALPATVLRYTLKNTGAQAADLELAGWLENAVCLHSAESRAGLRQNRVVRRPGFVFLECSALAAPATSRDNKRPDIVFDDFEDETYRGWTASGTAFGTGPVDEGKVPAYQGKLAAHGKRAVNSHAAAPGSTVQEKDAATGTLTSRRFVVERDFVNFLIGGGAHKGRTCLNLLVDGKIALSATGKEDNRMQPHTWDVRRWAGKEATFQIVDNEKGAWGNIGVDNIVFSDEPAVPLASLDREGDFGTMGIALLKADGSPKPKTSKRTPEADTASAALATGEVISAIFAQATHGDEAASKPFGEKLTGALSRRLSLAPGATATVTYLVTWYFPNLKLGGLGEHEGRWYGKRFPDALAVTEHVAGNFERLNAQTRLWHETWYASTLPWWFLDRTFLNTSILASSTCFWLGNGRFYAWEGVGCCAGTCGHVWHYAHAMARLFPSLERSAREMADYGVGYDPDSGRIRFRAEHNDHWAVDGQAGVILRTYREHQMSADPAFLRRVWRRARKALQFLIGKDQNADGIIDGPQHNTLDTDWWGEIAWLSGLYLAALRAGAAMAQEMQDAAFAQQCLALADKGSRSIVERLFDNGYFVNRTDPRHLDTINSGSGCEIDQVFGQSWAFQVGLERVLPAKETRSALEALWRYNFTPDVGPYRAAYKPGRWYAMPGEAGLLMCSFPRADWDYSNAAGKGPDWAAGYFNECMNGFEYQAAGHMIWEGLLQEGLAVTRAVHDRYHAARRNPWNEIECGDHYARSMASYGVFLAACGYEHHGPNGHLAFAPRLNPGNFRAAFTTAEGWGTFSQQMQERKQTAQVHLKWGKLRLRTLALGATGPRVPTKATVRASGRRVPASVTVRDGKTRITFGAEIWLREGEKLEVTLT